MQIRGFFVEAFCGRQILVLRFKLFYGVNCNPEVLFGLLNVTKLRHVHRDINSCSLPKI